MHLNVCKKVTIFLEIAFYFLGSQTAIFLPQIHIGTVIRLDVTDSSYACIGLVLLLKTKNEKNYGQIFLMALSKLVQRT